MKYNFARNYTGLTGPVPSADGSGRNQGEQNVVADGHGRFRHRHRAGPDGTAAQGPSARTVPDGPKAKNRADGRFPNLLELEPYHL